jgi:integrase
MTTTPRGGSYYTAFMVKGARYNATFSTFDAGERWELEVRHAIKLGKPIPEAKAGGRVSGGKVKTLGDVVAHTLKHTFKGKGDYHDKIEMIGRQMEAFLGSSREMSTITRTDVDNLIHHWQSEHNNSDATLNRKMSAVRAFFRTAVELNVIERAPAFPRRRKELAHKIRFLSDKEEARIVATLRSWDDDDLADMVVFALDTGARFSEIIKAPWDWFQQGNSSWIIWERKANNPLAMPLTQRSKAIITERHERLVTHPGPFVSQTYASVRWRLERVLDHLEIEDVTFHTFRHTTASRLVQRGVDIRRVKEWMGHKAIATTLRYAHLQANALDDVAKVLEAA